MKKQKRQKINGNQDRITIVISELLSHQIREESVSEGVSISKFVADIIKKELLKNKES